MTRAESKHSNDEERVTHAPINQKAMREIPITKYSSSRTAISHMTIEKLHPREEEIKCTDKSASRTPSCLYIHPQLSKETSSNNISTKTSIPIIFK